MNLCWCRGCEPLWTQLFSVLVSRHPDSASDFNSLVRDATRTVL